MAETFMAKPDEKEPGSSCHMHINLSDLRSNKNIFHGTSNLGPVEECSNEFRWFLGGFMKHLPDLMILNLHELVPFGFTSFMFNTIKEL